MIILKFIFCIIQLVTIINLAQSRTICLDNSVLTCSCDDTLFVSCIGRSETNDSFMDWSTFSSINHSRQIGFEFLNLTRLTHFSFTNFSKAFPQYQWINLEFINGLDEIGENTFQELSYYSDLSQINKSEIEHISFAFFFLHNFCII